MRSSLCSFFYQCEARSFRPQFSLGRVQIFIRTQLKRCPNENEKMIGRKYFYVLMKIAVLQGDRITAKANSDIFSIISVISTSKMERF
jgi:hypothetical protein